MKAIILGSAGAGLCALLAEPPGIIDFFETTYPEELVLIHPDNLQSLLSYEETMTILSHLAENKPNVIVVTKLEPVDEFVDFRSLEQVFGPDVVQPAKYKPVPIRSDKEPPDK